MQERVVNDLRDALEAMVEQYLVQADGKQYRHLFMTAGELASEALAKHFPARWRLTADGVERLDRD